MIRIRTGSRLHFGLIRLPPEPWPADAQSYFGGVGLMIEEPSLEVLVTPVGRWDCRGEHSSRVARLIELLRRAQPEFNDSPCSVRVVRTPPQHRGFGLGTQLGLAVARGLALSAGLEVDTESLARWAERGRRSAIGVHGFAHGGLIRDAGKTDPKNVGKLDQRLDFPTAWRIIIAVPPTTDEWFGHREALAFSRIPSTAATNELNGLADGIMTAAANCDFRSFGQAVHAFNALVGDQFHGVQGGRYASADVADLVDAMVAAGALGVGQSSWGPAVFGFADTALGARDLAERLKATVPSKTQLIVSAARNRGAESTETEGA